MTVEQLEKMLNDGEGFTVEFKECVDRLSGSVYETVCAFSNRYGGHILLGVREVTRNGRKIGEVIGVNPEKVVDIKKNFVTVLNNANKIAPALFLNFDEIEYKGKKVLWVYVPVTSQLQMCDGRIFDRNEDADEDITNSVDLVANLARRKSSEYLERKIFPYCTKEHLEMTLVSEARRMAVTKNSSHPWRDMDDMELLRSAGLYEENMLTGEKGFNLAGILLFGKPETIRSCVPGYYVDAIYRYENQDRYDDRMIVDQNLIKSFDILMRFIQKHTNDSFYTENNAVKSVRDAIAREIVSNILVHREFGSPFPAKIIIERDRLYAENWNRAQRVGRIEPQNFNPYPKNPLLAAFFTNIGNADSLGSGVRNLYKYTKIYSGAEPDIEEGDIFSVTIPIHNSRVGDEAIEISSKDKQGKSVSTVHDAAYDTAHDAAYDTAHDSAYDRTMTVSQNILNYCQMPRSKDEILKYCGFKSKSQFTAHYFMPLIREGELVMTLPDKPRSKNQKYITAKHYKEQ